MITRNPLRRQTPSAIQRKHQGSKEAERAATVKKIRGILGRTQAELASAIGVSEKAVQSYEQGWRKVPLRVMIQLLVLLALYRKHTLDDIPCWEIRKCAPAQREQCASFTVGRGQFCWFIGSKACRPPPTTASGPILPCMECPVIQRLLSGKRVSRNA
jgi:DNA-binding XRE family transcriptional regulator